MRIRTKFTQSRFGLSRLETQIVEVFTWTSRVRHLFARSNSAMISSFIETKYGRDPGELVAAMLFFLRRQSFERRVEFWCWSFSVSSPVVPILLENLPTKPPLGGKCERNCPQIVPHLMARGQQRVRTPSERRLASATAERIGAAVTQTRYLLIPIGLGLTHLSRSQMMTRFPA